MQMGYSIAIVVDVVVAIELSPALRTIDSIQRCRTEANQVRFVPPLPTQHLNRTIINL